MARVVGGFLVPHDPLVFAAADAAPSAQRDTVHDAYATVARRIGELDATTVIIIGCDHYILFGPGCLPPMLIAIGDVEGPIERIPGLVRGAIENNEALAHHILEYGWSNGVDWAVAKALTVDHAIGIPNQLCVRPNVGTRTIPVYLNSGVDPRISLQRSRAVGESIRSAVLSFPAAERVVVIGSGGISHWVGEAESGRVNEAFDRLILAMVEAANIDGLTALDDDYVYENGGNGAHEIRNFVCAMAAVAPSRGKTIAYEPVPEWITGLGFCELIAA